MLSLYKIKSGSLRIDETDMQILGILLRDSRTPLAHISKEIGISSPAIRERINKLKLKGVIRGFSTRARRLRSSVS